MTACDICGREFTHYPDGEDDFFAICDECGHRGDPDSFFVENNGVELYVCPVCDTVIEDQ